jgi:hypothetical protein
LEKTTAQDTLLAQIIVSCLMGDPKPLSKVGVHFFNAFFRVAGILAVLFAFMLRVPNYFPFNQIDHFFGNVSGVIRKTLYVAGNKQQIY